MKKLRGKLKMFAKETVQRANNLRKKIQRGIKPTLLFVWKAIKNLLRKIIKIDIIFLLIGICINAIICKIFPQFPKWFPVVHGWFDGWVQFNLFIVKSLVNGVYAVSEGNWTEYCYEFHNTFHKMVIQFVKWVNNVRI